MLFGKASVFILTNAVLASMAAPIKVTRAQYDMVAREPDADLGKILASIIGMVGSPTPTSSASTSKRTSTKTRKSRSRSSTASSSVTSDVVETVTATVTVTTHDSSSTITGSHSIETVVVTVTVDPESGSAKPTSTDSGAVETVVATITVDPESKSGKPTASPSASDSIETVTAITTVDTTESGSSKPTGTGTDSIETVTAITTVDTTESGSSKPTASPTGTDSIETVTATTTVDTTETGSTTPTGSVTGSDPGETVTATVTLDEPSGSASVSVTATGVLPTKTQCKTQSKKAAFKDNKKTKHTRVNKEKATLFSGIKDCDSCVDTLSKEGPQPRRKGDFSATGAFYLTDEVTAAAQYACAAQKRKGTVAVFEYEWNPEGMKTYEFSSPNWVWKSFIRKSGMFKSISTVNDMVSGPLRRTKNVTGDFWQYAVTSEKGVKNLTLKRVYRNITCKNIPSGNLC